MRKMILLLVFLSMFLLAWGARKEGFFPYPADPVTIVIQSTNRLVGAGYPGSANGPRRPPARSLKTSTGMIYLTSPARMILPR